MSGVTKVIKKAPVKDTPLVSDRDDLLEPISWLMFGPPGSGKTSCAAHSPSPVILRDSQEKTIDRLIKAGEIPVSTPVVAMDRVKRDDNINPDENHPWPKTLSTIRLLPEKYPNHRTLILDSLTGFQKLCFDYVCRKEYANKWGGRHEYGFLQYAQGPKTAAHTYWPELLDACDEIQDEAGWNVILIAHETTKSVPDPEFGAYDRFTPYLEKDVWSNTHRWAQMVLRLSYRRQQASKDGEPRKRVKSTGERIIYTQPNALWDAKGPSMMDEEIDMGDSPKEAWDNLWEAYKEAMNFHSR